MGYLDKTKEKETEMEMEMEKGTRSCKRSSPRARSRAQNSHNKSPILERYRAVKRAWQGLSRSIEEGSHSELKKKELKLIVRTIFIAYLVVWS